MESFDSIGKFRIFDHEARKVKQIVDRSENYDSVSHFYRCAVIKLIRECEKHGNK